MKWPRVVWGVRMPSGWIQEYDDEEEARLDAPFCEQPAVVVFCTETRTGWEQP